MIPIHELFSRIRWDAEFGAADFEVGYYDRVKNAVVRIPFTALHFDPADHFAFRILDRNGEAQTIPFHRVRAVWRNGELIWRRGGGGLASG